MNNIKLLNKTEELTTLIKDNKYVVVDFYADWCGPCKALTPVIEDIAQTETNVVFVKVNVDNFQDLAEKYGISAIPTLVYFKDGVELTEKTFGFVPKPKLLTAINNLKAEK